jgi:hypothetical protein
VILDQMSNILLYRLGLFVRYPAIQTDYYGFTFSDSLIYVVGGGNRRDVDEPNLSIKPIF